MTRQTNARLAGLAFLLYIAFGIASLVFTHRAAAGETIGEKLGSLAQHAGDIRVAAILTMLCAFAAIILGVTLYAITRDQDSDLAMLGLTCRVAEGVMGGLAAQGSLGLLWLASAAGAADQNTGAVQTLAAFLREGDTWSPVIAGLFFAVGSTFFAWLLLRGRMIPVPLAWLGVAASVLLVIALPLRMANLIDGLAAQLIWLPMAAFEIPLAIWFLVKGVAPERRVDLP
jgi:hypothetical protein